MSAEINDGGQAFPGFQDIPGYGCSKPVSGPNGDVLFENHTPGMSLRAWLTGKALQGMLANPTVGSKTQVIVECAVEYADAVIAELSKPQTTTPKPNEIL